MAAALVLAAIPATLPAGALDKNLVAHWTFKDGSLKSSVGKFTFEEAGRGSTESDAGSITVNGKGYLICTDLNSNALQDLNGAVTIWARVRFDELPPEYVTNFMSFQTEPNAGDWKEMAFSMLFFGQEPDGIQPGVSFLARYPDGELGIGPSRFQPVTAGEFVDVAMVFDGSAGRASLWVAGTMVSSEKREAEAFNEFAAFALGQLKVPGPDIKITFDEVRIYSTVLDENWLAEIKAEED